MLWAWALTAKNAIAERWYFWENHLTEIPISNVVMLRTARLHMFVWIAAISRATPMFKKCCFPIENLAFSYKACYLAYELHQKLSYSQYCSHMVCVKADTYQAPVPALTYIYIYVYILKEFGPKWSSAPENEFWPPQSTFGFQISILGPKHQFLDEQLILRGLMCVHFLHMGLACGRTGDLFVRKDMFSETYKFIETWAHANLGMHDVDTLPF